MMTLSGGSGGARCARAFRGLEIHPRRQLENALASWKLMF